MEYPEISKMKAVQSQSQSIGEFIEWLNENCMHIGEWVECDHQQSDFQPIQMNIEQILAKYFEIDLKKVEEERQAILEEWENSECV